MKKLIITTIKIAVLVFLFIWIVIVFTDYFRVRNGNDPMFCLSEQIKDYDDGTTYICTGLGYKMIRYNRTKCQPATVFGPFIIKDNYCE